MLSLGKQEIIISVVGIDRKGCPASSFNPTGSLRRKLTGSMCNEDPSIVGDGVGGGATGAPVPGGLEEHAVGL